MLRHQLLKRGVNEVLEGGAELRVVAVRVVVVVEVLELVAVAREVALHPQSLSRQLRELRAQALQRGPVDVADLAEALTRAHTSGCVAHPATRLVVTRLRARRAVDDVGEIRQVQRAQHGELVAVDARELTATEELLAAAQTGLATELVGAVALVTVARLAVRGGRGEQGRHRVDVDR